MNHLTATLAQSHWIPVAIFLATYILIAVESGRGSHLDRTAAAFCGAVAMVLVGAVPLAEAYLTIDWNTLIFLLGIMILVAHFQISGFFDWIAVHVAAIARTRFQLLVLLVFATGILAAFFVNDTICLIFTPIVLVVTQRLEVPPLPYLIAVATSANIGSVMSVTGNPQNAVIGVSAHFSFLGFLAHLAPVSLVGLVVNAAVLSVFFRREIFRHPLKRHPPSLPVKLERRLLIKCCVAAALVIVGASDMVSVVVRSSLLQLATPPEMRGRVSAVNWLFIGASNEFGEFESGVTAQWWGAVRAVVIGGIASMVVTASAAGLFPQLRRADALTAEALMASERELSTAEPVN